MKSAYSDFMKALNDGKFVFTGEIEPKKTTRLEGIIGAAKTLKSHVVACNVTDNPRARAYLSSLVASYVIQKETGLETICHMTVRDRNRLALISDLLGASALGIRNVLVISGDHTTGGDNPGAMPVYDLDSTQFVQMVRGMVDRGIDLNGNAIEGEVRLHVGVVGNPNADPLEVEVCKVERKINAGAEFIQTQIVFDVDKAKRFVKELNSSVPILIGIFPCKSHRIAEFIVNKIPGIYVPREYIEGLKSAESFSNATESRNKIDTVNIDYFSELIKELKRTTRTAGIHIMTMGYESIVGKITDRVMEKVTR
ncbi:MAG: methylenetetrahydrofolate reductase [Candidatus Methanomethyliaceae archaeon]|nr:methylenetetrahydrofolate reductase [Candidatus Methanomethyliaceae archaeon]